MTTWIVGAGGQDGKVLADQLSVLGEQLILQFRTEILFPDGSVEKIRNMSASMAAELIKEFSIDKIYFLAAYSRPKSIRGLDKDSASDNFIQIEKLFENICKAVIIVGTQIKLFLASSSLIFSGSFQSPQNEETIPSPLEPYAISKVRMSETLFKYSRKSEQIKPIVGIFYNHESVFRTEFYLSHKVINHALDVYDGKKEKKILKLRGENSRFDVSHANDFMRNLIILMNTNFTGNCVFSSGYSIGIKDFCKLVFQELNLNYKEHIYFETESQGFSREILLQGDNSLLKRLIPQPEVFTPEQTIRRLVGDWQTKRENIAK